MTCANFIITQLNMPKYGTLPPLPLMCHDEVLNSQTEDYMLKNCLHYHKHCYCVAQKTTFFYIYGATCHRLLPVYSLYVGQYNHYPHHSVVYLPMTIENISTAMVINLFNCSHTFVRKFIWNFPIYRNQHYCRDTAPRQFATEPICGIRFTLYLFSSHFPANSFYGSL